MKSYTARHLMCIPDLERPGIGGSGLTLGLELLFSSSVRMHAYTLL